MGRGGEAGKRGRGKAQSAQGGLVASELRETPVRGAIPRFEIPGWPERYKVVAGITGRGTEAGRGFDLGLWSTQPVGEVMSRWSAFRRAFSGFHAVALGNQVHGVELMSLDAGRGWIQVDGIDGWITTAPGVLLTVTVADCVPIYLVAPERGVALLHAGWRGTAGRILTRGVERVKAETGCVESEIVMHCGVGICGSCYEVGPEVMRRCGAAADGDGPWHIDLRERLASEASELGLTSISSSTWCSAHGGPSFYSHRASGGTDGRMVAYIGMLTRPPRLIDSNLIPE
jgi:purine-nucleoside/S-methyl-5'-thioadenosine phosphorylase / adenosine deaminase